MQRVELERPRTRTLNLMCGVSVGLLASIVAVGASAQTAAAAKDGTELTEVIVTGSSIRGAPPVGSNLVSVSQADIQKSGAQTIQQVLRSVPSVVGMQAVGQGAFGSADGAGTNAPTIHGLGASASNSTLILIDGHRFPLSGINHALADPNILAPLALERVEVLADGASSVYGSDAVAGVVNFITRRNFDGVEVRAQAGYADGYNSYGAGAVAGKTWDTGSVLAALGWSDRDGLLAAKRDYAARNRLATGGSNLAAFACSPATIQVGAGNIIPAPYTGAGVANAQANALCDYSGVIDLFPSERRYTGMVKVIQDVGDKLRLTGDLIYSDRHNNNRDSRGSVQATIFGPGSAAALTPQINPFFIAPSTSPTATSESVRWDANELLGPGAHTEAGEETGYFNASAEYKFNDNWRLTAGGTVGFNNSFTDALGALCASCANLALNGTTNGGGSLTTPSIPGTGIIVLNTPLTTANALDVFRSGAANRTSALVLSRLTDSEIIFRARQTIGDATLKLDGSAFQIPGGDVKVAVGLEYIKYTLEQNRVGPNGTGPATTGSTSLHLDYDRNVKSAYIEVLVPVVSPEMEVPLMHSLDINLSGRYDDYSDFGNTENPRIAVNWGVIEGLKFRANYAESFVAPALTSRGADALGTTAETSVTAFAGTLNVPTAAYPTIIGGVPGCNPGAVTCTVGGAIAGLQVNGGNAALKPQTGKSWSIGSDWDPSFAPGLRLSLTFWHNKLTGAITAPQAAFAVNAEGLNSLLIIYPNGATPAQIAALVAGKPLQTTIPNTTYFSYNFQQRNALNLEVEGIDASVDYGFDTEYGRFTVSGIASYETKFDQQVGTGGAHFSVKNTTGFNTTFPSIKLNSRVQLDWESKFGLSTNVSWNHTGSYHNWSGTTIIPLTRNAQGVPTGGGDKVDAGDFFDLHVAYEFDGEGMTSGLQVFVDVNNVFDKDPPFYNSNNGYDTFSGNPIGRLTTIGVRKKW